MDRQETIERVGSVAAELRRRFGIAELALFGSVARGDAGEASDVDFLVEFQGRADFDRYMDLKFFLEDLLGRRVDLVTRKALKPRLRPSVDAEAVRVA